MSSNTCPKCRRITLRLASDTVVLRHGSAPILECPGCSGLWIPHLALSPGVELNTAPPSDSPTPSIPPEGDHRTGLCPEGHGILIRARAELDRSFHVERCPLCRGVWLDRGEWRRLSAAGLLGHLDDLWDPSWQKRQRDDVNRRHLDGSLRDALGDELYAGLLRVVTELHAHPARSQALAWIVDHLEGEAAKPEG
jgi:Zn-finger nucleic acid-binding protein